MIDIIVANIPYIMPSIPPAAPAALKGYLESRGFSVVTKDLNLRMHLLIDDIDLLTRLHTYWIDNDAVMSENDKSIYWPMLDQLAGELTNYGSRWIGLSLFTDQSQKFCKDFLPLLQQRKKPDARIVIGGRGVNHPFVNTVSENIDCYIDGDGELALENLLNENWQYPGINSSGQQMPDLDLLPTPDYSDYEDLDKYDHYYDSPVLQLTGSRGCVRRCSFCNVPNLWPKYQFRSGDLLADDIIKMHASTGVHHYVFTDSLINGNVRELKKMMIRLAEYKKNTGSPITWGGQWIARKQQGLPKDYYELIKASGGDNLTIGVETGSDRVREHMKKGFTSADLDAEMEQFSRHGIRCGFFMMVGYPTENREDFIETLDMLKRYTKYVADQTLVGVIFNKGFFLLPDTPIAKNQDKIWRVENENRRLWHSLVADVDYVESMYRRIVIQQVAEQLKWPANNIVFELSNFLTDQKTMLRDRSKTDVVRHDMNSLLPQYELPKIPSDMDIQIEMSASFCEGWPIIDVIINNELVMKDLEVQNDFCVKVKVTRPRRKNVLKFVLKNKQEHNTKLDNLGNIEADMGLTFQSICFGEVRQRKDDLYLQGRLKKTDRSRSLDNSLHFANSHLRFYFENPTLTYFLDRKPVGYNDRYRTKHQKIMQRLIDFYRSL